MPDTASDDDNFAVRVTTLLNIISAGDVTFGFNVDDGARLIIDGSTIATDDVVSGPSDTFGTINLSTGIHTLNFMYFTSTGGAEAELFIARENGTFTSFSGGGSPASGFEILEAVPEPSTYAMLGLGIAALVAYRRKCRKAA